MKTIIEIICTLFQRKKNSYDKINYLKLLKILKVVIIISFHIVLFKLGNINNSNLGKNLLNFENFELNNKKEDSIFYKCLIYNTYNDIPIQNILTYFNVKNDNLLLYIDLYDQNNSKYLSDLYLNQTNKYESYIQKLVFKGLLKNSHISEIPLCNLEINLVKKNNKYYIGIYTNKEINLNQISYYYEILIFINQKELKIHMQHQRNYYKGYKICNHNLDLNKTELNKIIPNKLNIIYSTLFTFYGTLVLKTIDDNLYIKNKNIKIKRSIDPSPSSHYMFNIREDSTPGIYNIYLLIKEGGEYTLNININEKIIFEKIKVVNKNINKLELDHCGILQRNMTNELEKKYDKKNIFCNVYTLEKRKRDDFVKHYFKLKVDNVYIGGDISEFKNIVYSKYDKNQFSLLKQIKVKIFINGKEYNFDGISLRLSYDNKRKMFMLIESYRIPGNYKIDLKFENTDNYTIKYIKKDDNKPIEPRLFIISGAYNVEKYVGGFLISLLKEDYKDFQLYIVDDKSSDRTLEIINYYAKLDSRIKVIKQERLGHSTTLNNALKHIKGLFLNFFDPDDFLFNNTYLNAINTCIDYNVNQVIQENAVYREDYHFNQTNATLDKRFQDDSKLYDYFVKKRISYITQTDYHKIQGFYTKHEKTNQGYYMGYIYTSDILKSLNFTFYDFILKDLTLNTYINYYYNKKYY